MIGVDGRREGDAIVLWDTFCCDWSGWVGDCDLGSVKEGVMERAVYAFGLLAMLAIGTWFLYRRGRR
jgi:hypothetical protein